MRAKIGYMAILVLMGFLYLWTNVAVTFYLFFGLLLFAILSFLLNWYAARHLTMHLQVKQDLNQVSTILICVKNTGLIPCFRVSMKGTIANCLTDSSFCFNQELSVAPKQEKRWNLLLKASIVEELKWKQTNLLFEIFLVSLGAS